MTRRDTLNHILFIIYINKHIIVLFFTMSVNIIEIMPSIEKKKQNLKCIVALNHGMALVSMNIFVAVICIGVSRPCR